MEHRFRALICSVFLALLASCGGGSSGGGTVITTTFSGKVIDGYIKNAKVCLDLNENLKCDDGPGQEEEKYTTMSKENGAYSFVYTGTRDVSTLHIIAEATENSIDEDDNGKTFKDAGRNPVTLLTPAPAPQAITPLTTVVSNQQITAKEAGKTLTMADAEKEAKLLLNMPSVSLVNNDYKDTAKGDADLAKVAKAMTLALADTQKTIKDNADFKSAVVMTGKSLEAEAIKQAVSAVNSEISKNVTDGKLTAASVGEVAKNATAQLIQGRIQDIVKVVAAPAASSWNPLKALTDGIYNLAMSNGVWFGNGKTPESPIYQAGFAPQVGGAKLSDDGKTFMDSNDWSIRNGDSKYSKLYRWSEDYYLVEGQGWVKDPIEGSATTIDSNCVRIVSKTDSQEGCGKVTPWEGKTVKAAGFCSTPDKNTYFKVCAQPDLVFPKDAYSYDISLTQMKDQYRIWGVENGPNIPFTYKQEGTLITFTVPAGYSFRNCDNGCELAVDFTSGTATDGYYKNIQKVNDSTFTVQAKDSRTTYGTASAYWGAWIHKSYTNLTQYVQDMIKENPQFDWDDCQVMGKFITSKESASGFAIEWQKGSRVGNKCTANLDKKYEQTTALVFDSVYGYPIMRSVASDAYKLAKDDYYGVELLWAVAKNPAGVNGVFNGKIRRASVKRELTSGVREAIGNRVFVDTINKAWGYPSLPSASEMYAK